MFDEDNHSLGGGGDGIALTGRLLKIHFYTDLLNYMQLP